MIFPSPVRADGSRSIFIGCGILHVPQSSTAGNALLISSICAENEPEYGIVWFPDMRSERDTRCRQITGSQRWTRKLDPKALRFAVQNCSKCEIY
jgi:hypothetical protein